MFEMGTVYVVRSISGVPLFLLYLAVATALLTLFLLLYLKATRHDEIGLIRAGNASAAVSLSGAMIGFCLPLSKALAQAASIPDLVIWAGLALIVQLTAYGIANLVVPQLSEKIEQNMLSAALISAGLSITCGMLSAAAMTE